MPTRQYIGARYVPKFFENSATNDSTWAANTIYEPLTIVTWNGTSYTSKKRVPAGIGNPSANPEYWAATGQESQQVDALRVQLENLEARVDLMNIEWSDKNVIAIGDSYAEGYTPEDGSVPSNGWSAKLRTFLGIPASQYKNKYVGGCGFTTISSNGGFIGALNDVYTDNPNFVADAIIVAGGRNDHSAVYNTIVNDITSFMARAESIYPGVKVYISMCAWDMDATVQQGLANTLRAYIEGCQGTNAIYLSNTEYLLHNPELLSPSDGKHPTNVGNTRLARGFANILNGCGCDVHYKKACELDNPVTGATFNTLSVYEEVSNDISKIYAGNIAVNYSSNAPDISCDGTRYKICECGNLINQTAQDIGIQVPMELTLRDSSNKYYCVNGYLIFLGGEVSISAREVNDTGSGFLTLNGVNRIQINRFEYSFPSMP